MTTTTPAPRVTAPHRAATARATRHTIRWLLRRNLRLAGWAVLVLVVGVVVGAVLVDRLATVELSIAQFARQGFIWFPFAMMIGASSTYVNVHVAAGMTRRAMGRATVLVALTMAAFYTVVMTAALQLEHLAFEALGWGQEITEDGTGQLFTDSSQVGMIVLDLGLLFVTAHLCGLLVGATYYRAGGWWGTLALPLTAGPVLLVTPILASDGIGSSLGVRVAIVVTVLAALATAYLVVNGRTPVRPAT